MKNSFVLIYANLRNYALHKITRQMQTEVGKLWHSFFSTRTVVIHTSCNSKQKSQKALQITHQNMAKVSAPARKPTDGNDENS